jgi:UDP-N-acetylglucosamine--N-acetylmuramyl-(pentapeptide) pyrophosphoryl-undecaprenol N-acetylglucosamine transferase
MNSLQHKKIIISGGGTGGHIFPAISIANALKSIDPNIDILFVGAEGRMEMEKVPAAGYKIIGLPVVGFQRRLTLKNISFFWKLFKSIRKAKSIIFNFKPDAVVGVGGYASGPILRIATKQSIPSLIQEQNSFPGVTNRLLAKKVNKICVAYEGMEKFFPSEKIIMTGNPVRQDLENISTKKDEALVYFDLQGNKKVILIVGGSLGARTINESIYNNIDVLIENKLQLIWQTGKDFFSKAKNLVAQKGYPGIKVYDFISRMDLAFSISDIVVSRAGASTISELCLVHKPCIFVPSPNVAEDHQTKNAMKLVMNNAAMMIEDKDSINSLVNQIIELSKDEYKIQIFKENISKMAFRNSASTIANEILKMIK